MAPHDKGISKAIEENLEPWPESWNTEEALRSPLLKDPYEDIHKQYFKAIQKHCHHRCHMVNYLQGGMCCLKGLHAHTHTTTG